MNLLNRYVNKETCFIFALRLMLKFLMKTRRLIYVEQLHQSGKYY